MRYLDNQIIISSMIAAILLILLVFISLPEKVIISPDHSYLSVQTEIKIDISGIDRSKP